MNYFFYLCPPLQDMVANVRGIHAWRKEYTVYDYNNGDQYNESDQNNGQKGYDDHLYVVINGILTNQYNKLAFGDVFISMHCI